MKVATSRSLDGLARLVRHVIAGLVAVVTLGAKRTTTWVSAVSTGAARSSTLAREDESRLAGADDLIFAPGSCEPVGMHGGVFGYKDEAGVRHPLF